MTHRVFQRMKDGVLLLTLLVFFAGLFRSGAHAESTNSEQASEIWQVERGWEEDTVTSLVQSRDGYLWLGTYHGLVRFDGVHFTLFDSGNTPGLQNGVITSLCETPEGVLWVGHETGQLTRFADGRFQAVALGPNWPGGAIEGMATDDQRDLWLLNVSGCLFRVRDGKPVNVSGSAAPVHNVALARNDNGQIWVVANGAIATLESGKLTPFIFPDAQASDYFERVLPAHDGGLWVVGNGRLRKWHHGRWVEMPGLPPNPGTVTCLWETRAGAVLAGTLRDGVWLLSPGFAPLHFDRENGLSQNWVRALCENHEGGLWIGTGGGFDSLRLRKVHMLNEPKGWRGCRISSFQVLSDGSAWVGTEGAGVYRYADRQWNSFTESSGLSNLFVWSVLQTKQQQLLVGTWGGGLFEKNGNRFVPAAGFSSITSPALSLFEGRDGDLWIGTTAGLHRYHAGKQVWFAGKEKLVLPDVRAITESADGTLWFGMSGGGLGQLKNGSLRQFLKPDGLGGEFVVSLYAEPDNTLWIGTGDNGLTRLKEGHFAVISTANGLPTPVISHIVDDRSGNLWFGSKRGILRASKADLDRCADGRANVVRFLTFSKAEGLASEICSGGFQPGACLAADGRLWFPTARGLAIIDPANASTNTAKPPVIIEGVLVDAVPVAPAVLSACVQSSGLADSEAGKLVADQHQGPATATDALPVQAPGQHAPIGLRIPPGRHRFEFQFTALSFVDPDKVAFRYKLEGLERDWQNTTKRVAPYSYLPPGHYTFRVIACNNDDLWNDSGASLALAVLPYFWQTWWFEVGVIFAGACLVGAAVVWFTRRRVRRKLEQVERQRALERERSRIARDIHDDLGASLTRITMLSQSVRSEVEDHPQAAADVDRIYGTARELTRAMDEIVWAVNPLHDTLDSLVTYLGRFAQHFLSGAGIRCRLDVPLNLPAWELTSEVRHHVYLALKEALHNVVKHAGATEVRISLEMLPEGFVLLVADNGRGFDWEAASHSGAESADGARLSSGNGLRNMRKRLEEIGGRCEWETARGEGTRVKLAVDKAAMNVLPL